MMPAQELIHGRQDRLIGPGHGQGIGNVDHDIVGTRLLRPARPMRPQAKLVHWWAAMEWTYT